MKTVSLLWLAFFVTAAPAIATTPDGESAVVTNFTLDNGLEVVVVPDHRAPIVTHMLWYKAGSADEEPGASGVAHFFEHLMFKGTKDNPGDTFSKAIAAVGGDENAFTSYDFTAYYQQVAPQYLGDMMRMEADRMRNLVMSDEDIETERKVVLEERSMRTDNVPMSILHEEVMATLFQNHPYGISIIGWKQELEALSRDDLEAFYSRYYTPNNAILVVAGDVDAATVRRLAQETYGKIPRGPETGPRERPLEPEQKTARTVTYSDPRVAVPSVSYTSFLPSPRRSTEGEYAAQYLMSEILGSGVRSRLYQQLVVKKKIATRAGAYIDSQNYDYSRLSIYAEPGEGIELSVLEEAIKEEIDKLKRDGVTEEELEAARTRLTRQLIFLRDDQSFSANVYGATLATGGTIQDVIDLPERLKAVTPDDIRKAAERYLDLSTAVTGYLLPPQEDGK